MSRSLLESALITLAIWSGGWILIIFSICLGIQLGFRDVFGKDFKIGLRDVIEYIKRKDK